MNNLIVKPVPNKGRGIFAAKSFNKGEIIEECPVINLTAEEDSHIQKTVLGKYVYEWQDPAESVIVLGYGSLYNHSYSPNATYKFDFSRKLVVYSAISDISDGSEITINYNGTPRDKKPVEDFVPIQE